MVEPSGTWTFGLGKKCDIGSTHARVARASRVARLFDLVKELRRRLLGRDPRLVAPQQRYLSGVGARSTRRLRHLYAISPNSASCERVFALLKNLFGDQQFSALADYLESSLKLNYNKRRVG